MKQIDGSLMEGGGQLLRMATSYSAILGGPITVYNIRANRREPGLKPQHLTTLRAAAKICSAQLTGDEIGSREITFEPDKIRGGKYDIDIGTAGSISLLLQCINPLLWYADKPTTMLIKGGTAVNWSPPIPFLEHIIYKAYHAMSIGNEIDVKRHGFYPKGGGEVTTIVKPVEYLKPLKLGKPRLKEVRGLSVSGALPEHIAHRQASAAKKTLVPHPASIDANVTETRPLSPGSFVVCWCIGDELFLGSDSLGARGKTSEVVGREAAERLTLALGTGANLDRYTTDHMILPMSLAEGESVFKTSMLTLHTLTAIKIAETFTDAEFEVKGRLDAPGIISVKGVGYRR